MRKIMNTRNLLRADTAFLFLASFAALLADIAGYYFGAGLLGEQLIGNPLVIGAAEAHGLAVIVSFALVH